MKRMVKVYFRRPKFLRTIGHKDHWYFNLNLNYDPIFSRISHLVRPVADNLEKTSSETGDVAGSSFVNIFQSKYPSFCSFF